MEAAPWERYELLLKLGHLLIVVLSCPYIFPIRSPTRIRVFCVLCGIICSLLEGVWCSWSRFVPSFSLRVLFFQSGIGIAFVLGVFSSLLSCQFRKLRLCD